MNFHEMLETSSKLADFMLSGDLLLANNAGGDDGRKRASAVFGCACFAYPARQTPGGVDSVAVEVRVLDAQQRWKGLLLENRRYVFECSHPDEVLDEYVSAEPTLVPLPPLDSNDWPEWKKGVLRIFHAELERLRDMLNAQGVATVIDGGLRYAA